MSVDRLRAWLADRLISAPPPDRIVLRHASAGGQSDVVGREPVTEGPPAEVARGLADKLWAQAHGHALAFPGRPQTFRVVAVAKGKARASTAILVRAEGRTGGLASPVVEGTEPPTPAGQLSQFMRLLEACFAQTIGAQSGIIDSLARQNGELLRAQDRLLQDRVETVELLEDLRSQQFEREEKRAIGASARAERKKLVEAVADKALPHIGEVIGKVLPRLLGEREPDGEMTGKLQRILGALAPETLHSILKDLSPEEQAELEALFSVVAAKKKKETA